MPDSTLILDAPAMQRALTRIAHEIAERNEIGSEVVLVGIQRRGVELAERLGRERMYQTVEQAVAAFEARGAAP